MLARLRRFIHRHPNLAFLLALLILFGLAQLVLGTRPSPIETIDALEARISAGQPVIVELYSNL
ncbi:MAG: hypothetical protein HPY64_15610 [Anaerolineae bacterium]|nr:hypothetical protein [Anaerolineae bacterium]